MAVGIAAPTLFWTVWKSVQRVARQRRERDQAHAPPPELPVSSPPSAPLDRDRRRVPRRAGAVTAVQLRDTIGHGVELGYVLDRSKAGLRLSVGRAPVVGFPICLRAPNAPADTPWVEATVRWCARSNGKYQIGCEFARTPPWNVLLMFG
jgi:hypothetical protein